MLFAIILIITWNDICPNMSSKFIYLLMANIFFNKIQNTYKNTLYMYIRRNYNSNGNYHIWHNSIIFFKSLTLFIFVILLNVLLSLVYLF